MSGYITTYTGKHFWPIKPDPDRLCIEDVAHALSLLCRGNGHVSRFFSVGQHCIWCAREAMARGYSQKVVLACLLHDASECYLSDVPRPIKAVMGEYGKIEERLLETIYETFLGEALTEEELAQVKEVDDDLLWYDMKELLGEDLGGTAPRIHILLDYSFRPFAQVENDYLSLYEQLHDRREMARASIEELTGALLSTTEGFESYFNRYTGQIVRIPSRDNVILDTSREEEQIRERAGKGEEYVRLPGTKELDEPGQMAAFAETVLTPRDGLYLKGCLQKSHPGRHFKEGLEETGLAGEYEAFLKAAYEEKARQWCEKEEIPFE